MEIETPLGLDHFSGANFGRGARDRAADLRVLEIGREVERVREKHVAEQDAERIAPARVDCRLGAAAFRVIHDVVVHQRREMDQFDDDREIDMLRSDRAGRATAEEREERAQPFAASADGVGDISFDRWIKRSRSGR